MALDSIGVSLPSWERGLKFIKDFAIYSHPESLPSWERGLKSFEVPVLYYLAYVAPLVGAWIEIGQR